MLGPRRTMKTTMIKMLSVLPIPTVGAAVVLGSNVAKMLVEIRRRIGLVLNRERDLYHG